MSHSCHKSLEQRARAGWLRLTDGEKWRSLSPWVRTELMDRAAHVLARHDLLLPEDEALIEFTYGVLEDQRSICDAVEDFVTATRGGELEEAQYKWRMWAEMVGGW